MMLERIINVGLLRGDTLANFLACAYESKGRVFTDRTRVPYEFPQTFANREYRGVNDAFSYALREARDRDDVPVVMGGKFPRFSRPVLASITRGGPVELPAGTDFPVDKIWLPKEDFDWRALNMGFLPSWLTDASEVEKRLQLFDPRSLIIK